jgi:hypothetical protein
MNIAVGIVRIPMEILFVLKLMTTVKVKLYELVVTITLYKSYEMTKHEYQKQQQTTAAMEAFDEL